MEWQEVFFFYEQCQSKYSNNDSSKKELLDIHTEIEGNFSYQTLGTKN